MTFALRWKMSATTAPTAKTTPNTFSQSGAWTGRAQVFAEAELQQESGESDGRDHDQRQRAGEGATAGVDDDQRQGKQQQAGGEDGPAAWLGRAGDGLEVASGKAFRCKGYTAWGQRFQCDGLDLV